MKTTPRILVASAALLASTALIHGQEAPDPDAHGDPYVPVGRLAVNPTFVQAGVRPNLDWAIEYPAIFEDLAIKGGSGALATTQEVQVEVRILGVSFDDTQTGKDLPVAVWVRTGGGGNFWQLIHYGASTDVNPSKVLFKKWVQPGTEIDIAARGRSSSGGWHQVVWTIDESDTLENFASGDSVPDVLSPSINDDLESYTTAVLSEDEDTVEINPKDLVYFFELSANDPAQQEFNLQDIVALVQCRTKNNNGHGNNADGVDVSNPGQGHGGPNGILDPSGDVDDEIKTYGGTGGAANKNKTK